MKQLAAVALSIFAVAATSCSKPQAAKPQAQQRLGQVMAASGACSARLAFANGDRLDLVAASTRKVLAPDGVAPGSCVWTIGSVSSPNRRSLTAYLIRFADGRDFLAFVRDGAVYVGTFEAPARLSGLRVEGHDLVVESSSGRDRIPLDWDGPPPVARLGAREAVFETGEDFSDVAYARALRESLGSRRDGTCESQVPFLKPADEAVRVRLAEQKALRPSELDGANCIWKAGVAVADGGVRYGLYVLSWEGGINHSHWANSLLVLKDDRTFVGLYPIVPVARMEVVGAELIVHGDAGIERVHFGPHGPPDRVLLDASMQDFIPLSPKNVRRRSASPR